MKKCLLIMIAALFLMNACQGGEEKKVTKKKLPELSGKKILMVIAPRNFRDEEFNIPHSFFIKEGARVVVASTDTAEATGMLGMKVKPDKSLKDVNPLDFDALVLVGGSGSTVLWDNKLLHKYVRTAFENDKVIGAICLSPVVLVKSGILKGKGATCYVTPEVKRIFRENDVNLTGDPLNITGNIVTANGPAVAKRYAEKIAELLK